MSAQKARMPKEHRHKRSKKSFREPTTACAPGLDMHVMALYRTGSALCHDTIAYLRPLKWTFGVIGMKEYHGHLMIGSARSKACTPRHSAGSGGRRIFSLGGPIFKFRQYTRK